MSAYLVSRGWTFDESTLWWRCSEVPWGLTEREAARVQHEKEQWGGL